MYHRYQDFHYKVKGTENNKKAEKIPSEALNCQTLKNVNSSTKKAQGWDDGLFSSGLKCHSQSLQAAHRAISLTSQSLIFISSEFAHISKTGLGKRISSRVHSLLENNVQNILNFQFPSLQAIWTQWHYCRGKKKTPNFTLRIKCLASNYIFYIENHVNVLQCAELLRQNVFLR